MSDLQPTDQQTETGLCPPIHDDFRILLYGFDTIYLSFDQEVTQDMYDRLVLEQLEARHVRKERNAAYCSEWLDALVYPSGANGFGVIIDKGGLWTIKVQKGNEHRPGVYLEMRSQALHVHPGGPWGACEDAVTWMRETLFADAEEYDRQKIVLTKEKLSRLDLHLDYQGGWHPTLEDGERRLFIKPARAGWEPHMSGDTCTGYSIGKRRIMARIYNKTQECVIRNNDAYFELLRQQAGEAFDPSQDVWRVEFELKREGVEGFCLIGPQEEQDEDEEILAEMEGEDLPTIGTLKKALRWAPDLWRYLTTRWLRLVAPNEDKNRARWPVHSVWQQIQAGFTQAASEPLTDEQCQLVREQRHTGRRRLINRLAAGISASAYLMLETDPTLAVREFTAQMERLARQMADYQAQKKVSKRKRLDQQRQVAYLRNVEQLAHMAGGTFAISGVLKQQLPTVADMPDLMLHIADELEQIAQYKGGVPQMLYDKWCKEYKVVPPLRLFQLCHVSL
jgi:hypothetical protein